MLLRRSSDKNVGWNTDGPDYIRQQTAKAAGSQRDKMKAEFSIVRPTP